MTFFTQLLDIAQANPIIFTIEVIVWFLSGLLIGELFHFFFKKEKRTLRKNNRKSNKQIRINKKNAKKDKKLTKQGYPVDRFGKY